MYFQTINATHVADKVIVRKNREILTQTSVCRFSPVTSADGYNQDRYLCGDSMCILYSDAMTGATKLATNSSFFSLKLGNGYDKPARRELHATASRVGPGDLF